jgi:uncharacterized protein (TIGR02217 family)
MNNFHEIRFPLDVALGLHGGPERKTDIVITGSGREERNSRWANSRRKYDAGFAIKTIDALSNIVVFFEERRGRLTGFRLRDRLDHKSCINSNIPLPADQTIGIGDGIKTSFQLKKRYGTSFAPYDRDIKKPVIGTVRVAVSGVEKTLGTDFDLDVTTGIITFRAGRIPALNSGITAGFEFDVPVRFDTDYLDIDLSAFEAGAIPRIPLIEIIV